MRSMNLESSISQLNATLEATADGILVVDRKGRIINFNQKFINLWEIPAEIIREGDDNKTIEFVLTKLVNPEEFVEKIEYLYKNPTEESRDEIVFKDGRIFERYSMPQMLGEEIIGRVWSFSDVTLERETQQKLRDNEERLRILFETTGVGIFIMTDIFEDCNEEVCRIFECEKEDIIGRGPWEFSPEYQWDGAKSIDSAKEKIEAAREGKPIRFYWQHLTKRGRIIDTEVTLKSFQHQGTTYIQAILVDITERLGAENLKNALYNISESVNTTEDIDKLYSDIHQIIAGLMPANNFYLALYDETTKLLSFPYFVDEYDDAPEPKPLGRGLTEYVLRTGEDVLVDANKDLELREAGEVDLIGEPQAIWLGIALKLEGRNMGVMVLQDYKDPKAYGEKEKQLLVFVSEQIAIAIDRKRQIESLKKITRELRESNATKDKFFSILAHDLKNPFSTLLGYSEILTTEYHELDDESRLQFINGIKSVSEKTFELLEHLLNWSRSQTGRIKYEPKETKLFSIAEGISSLVQNNAELKDITLLNAVSKDVTVFADAEMTETVIRNLVTNAIKFTERGGRIEIFSEPMEDTVCISVRDNGVGMNQQTVDGLFQVDKTKSQNGTDGEEGTGLGLILCKEFVEKQGGKIWVESKQGEGSTFNFTLPVHQ